MSAADDVKKAWNDPGREPSYHRAQQARLRREWPVLQSAIVKLVRETPSRESITDEPRGAQIGPEPRIVRGQPVIQVHPSAGQVYLAGDGTGWWGMNVMPSEDDMREHIIEDVLLEHRRNTIGPCACGWFEPGRSHAAHVAQKIMEATR